MAQRVILAGLAANANLFGRTKAYKRGCESGARESQKSPPDGPSRPFGQDYRTVWAPWLQVALMQPAVNRWPRVASAP
jgi:hypothetical protein